MSGRTLAILSLIIGMAMTVKPASADDLPRQGQAEVFYSVDAEQVAAILKKGGFKTKILKNKVKPDEKPTWTINAESKEPFYMSADLRACNADNYPRGCLGIRLYASMDIEKSSQSAARRTVEAYNRDYYIGKAYISEDGKHLIFENYLMVEGGVTARNLEENLGNFLTGFNGVYDLFEENQKAVEA
ncbi:MAG: YbjN domain-containing protein [Caulobacter sp.]|nr:YbjN domain-containing protein [Caulobacter sp.]